MAAAVQITCTFAKDGWQFRARHAWRWHSASLTLEGFPSGKARDLLGIDPDFFMKWWQGHTASVVSGRVIASIPLPYTDVPLVVPLEPEGDEAAVMAARLEYLERVCSRHVETAARPYRKYTRVAPDDQAEFGISTEQLQRYADRYRADWTEYLLEQVNTSRADAFTRWLAIRGDAVRVAYLARVRGLSRWAPINFDSYWGYYSTGCWMTSIVDTPGDKYAMGPFRVKTCACRSACGCPVIDIWLAVTELEPLTEAERAEVEGKK